MHKDLQRNLLPPAAPCLSLQFGDNDVKVAEAPDQKRQASTREISRYSD